MDKIVPLQFSPNYIDNQTFCQNIQIQQFYGYKFTTNCKQTSSVLTLLTFIRCTHKVHLFCGGSAKGFVENAVCVIANVHSPHDRHKNKLNEGSTCIFLCVRIPILIQFAYTP